MPYEAQSIIKHEEQFINPYPANVENKVSSYTSKWRMGFNSAFKGLKKLYQAQCLCHVTWQSSIQGQ